MLPSAATCALTLHLPPYERSETLLDRIRTALEHGGLGFGKH